MFQVGKKEWTIFAGLIVLSLVPSLGGIMRLFELAMGGTFEALPANPRVELMPLPAVAHILSSALFSLLGALQLLPSFRRKHRRWHRVMGVILALSGLTSASTGLWMTISYRFPIELQGQLLFWVRLFVGTIMIYSIVVAVRFVTTRRFRSHGAWMLRAYALGQGAGTQALLFFPWIIAGAEPSGLLRDELMTMAWAINLAIAELIIRQSVGAKPSYPRPLIGQVP